MLKTDKYHKVKDYHIENLQSNGHELQSMAKHVTNILHGTLDDFPLTDIETGTKVFKQDGV